MNFLVTMYLSLTYIGVVLKTVLYFLGLNEVKNGEEKKCKKVSKLYSFT